MNIIPDNIINEKDPFLREIYMMGYDEVIESNVDNHIKLLRYSDKYIKIIPLFKLIDNFTIKGGNYKWLSDNDGSAERFRLIIQPDAT